MNAEHALCPLDVCGHKKQESLTFETKLEVSKKFDDRQRGVDIGRAFDLPITNERTICSNVQETEVCAQRVTLSAII